MSLEERGFLRQRCKEHVSLITEKSAGVSMHLRRGKSRKNVECDGTKEGRSYSLFGCAWFDLDTEPHKYWALLRTARLTLSKSGWLIEDDREYH